MDAYNFNLWHLEVSFMCTTALLLLWGMLQQPTLSVVALCQNAGTRLAVFPVLSISWQSLQESCTPILFLNNLRSFRRQEWAQLKQRSIILCEKWEVRRGIQCPIPGKRLEGQGSVLVTCAVNSKYPTCSQKTYEAKQNILVTSLPIHLISKPFSSNIWSTLASAF